MQDMFAYCVSLKSLNVSNFNTSNVTTMNGMFRAQNVIEKLDISSFNTSNVTDMGLMFKNCYKLKTIYVSNSWNTSSVKESTEMFLDSSNLTGDSGTTYNAEHLDATYAHIDGGTSNPGYLTLKSV